MSNLEIRIDDKACVGCGLCVDVCPTGVIRGQEHKDVPMVDKASECFGCLSCTEICPATAIAHDGVELAQSYYHDSRNLAMAAAMGSPPRAFNAPCDDAAVGNAVVDLGVRLLSVAAVLKQTLGSSLPAVGTMAGRTLASQLPRYQPPRCFDEALRLTERTLAPAWDIRLQPEGEDLLRVSVGACFVRRLCRRESIALGGDLCTLFYNYLAGYLSRIAGIRPRLTKSEPGESGCSYDVKVYRSGS